MVTPMSTYVLIHGGGDSAFHWHLLAPELELRGHDVVAVDLPTRDDAKLADYVDTVADAVGDRDRLIVVGQSLGAFTAPLVAARLRADLLVLIAGMIPKPGETAGAWWANTGYRPEVSHEDPVAAFLHDVPPPIVAEAQRAERGQASAVMDDPWPLDAWPDVPTRFVLCREDRFFGADWMRGVVRERLGIVPDEIGTGHCPALARPRELAELLEAMRAELVPYTVRRLTDVEDSAPGFGLADAQETRFSGDDLGAVQTGFTLQRIKPNTRPPFAHRHEAAEEVYVVIAGSGRVKLDDDIAQIERLDAIRVAPSVMRAFEAGPDGLELLAFGPRHPGDGEVDLKWWTD
jgi:pimeloyl-ACP methyl ester carboxylesterase/mannose-6-phosphate isomerase-like protein (cupin superfamily)